MTGVTVDLVDAVDLVGALEFVADWLASDRPGLEPSLSPHNGATYTRDESVIADYDCADEVGGSGIDTCVGTVPDGSAVDTATAGDHDFTVTATDRQGNTQTATHTYTVAIAPTIDLRSPSDGAVYGQHQVVNASYSCAPQAPGEPAIESCVGTVPSGEAVDTSSTGHHDFTVNVVDAAGNRASHIIGYQVEARRPDAMIRMTGRPNFVGDDVYNGSGLDQRVRVPVEYLGTERLDVRVQNDGPVDERMTLRGSAGTGRFQVRYLQGSSDITRAVVNGTYRTALLQPGRAERMTVVVTAGRLADRGDRLRVTLTASSRVDPTRRDTVAARITSTGLTLFTACYVIAPNCYNEVPVALVGGEPITFLARIAPAHAGTAEVWRRAPGSTTWAWVGAPAISSTGRIQWTWHTTPADIREADYSIQFRIPGQSQRSNILGVAVINPVD